MQFVVVKIGKEKFALQAEKVLQVENAMVITKLPYVADYVDGVINFEGEVLPQINLLKLFNYSQGLSDDYEVVITVVDGFKMALAVDSVIDKYTLDNVDDIEGQSGEEKPGSGLDEVNYIEKELLIDGESVFLINIEKLNGIIKPESDEEDNGSMLGVSREDVGSSSQNEKGYLLFRIGGETMAIELTEVTEVLEEETLTVMPNMPNYVNGLMNLRGEPLMIISGQHYLEIDSEYDGVSQILIIEKEGLSCGIAVDDC
jgi:purine-binding chemotaxis protein CheW